MSDEGRNRAMWHSRRPPLTGPRARLVWVGPDDLMRRLPLRALCDAFDDMPQHGGLLAASLTTLPAHLRDGPVPHAVLSPLFWQDGDVMETARLLSALDYSGPYRAVTPPLPRPGMIEDEVRALCPGLDFGLLALRRG